MRMYLRVFICQLALAQTLAYSPAPINNRRSMIENSLTAMLIPPSLFLAKEIDGMVDTKVDEKEQKGNDEKSDSFQEHDALGEYRIWRRRGSLWLKRRLEREEVAKQKKVSNAMEGTDMTLSDRK